jgi:hypothetical protein
MRPCSSSSSSSSVTHYRRVTNLSGNLVGEVSSQQYLPPFGDPPSAANTTGTCACILVSHTCTVGACCCYPLHPHKCTSLQSDTLTTHLCLAHNDRLSQQPARPKQHTCQRTLRHYPRCCRCLPLPLPAAAPATPCCCCCLFLCGPLQICCCWCKQPAATPSLPPPTVLQRLRQQQPPVRALQLLQGQWCTRAVQEGQLTPLWKQGTVSDGQLLLLLLLCQIRAAPAPAGGCSLHTQRQKQQQPKGAGWGLQEGCKGNMPSGSSSLC